jgi:hypothetical protein
MEWVVNATPRSLYPQVRYPVPIVQEVGWTSVLPWTGAENLAQTGNRNLGCPARRNCAVPAHTEGQNIQKTEPNPSSCRCLLMIMMIMVLIISRLEVARQSYCETKKRTPTNPSLIMNQTSQCVVIKEGHIW